jgi:hypothetical protein
MLVLLLVIKFKLVALGQVVTGDNERTFGDDLHRHVSYKDHLQLSVI